jgi:hypothetical protein
MELIRIEEPARLKGIDYAECSEVWVTEDELNELIKNDIYFTIIKIQREMVKINK